LREETVRVEEAEVPFDKETLVRLRDTGGQEPKGASTKKRPPPPRAPPAPATGRKEEQAVDSITEPENPFRLVSAMLDVGEAPALNVRMAGLATKLKSRTVT
jgi:hypothetical protein